MSNQLQKEIESLRIRLADLEATQENELRQREVLESSHAALLSTLDDAGVTLESYVRCFLKDYRRILSKIDRESAKAGNQPDSRPVRSRKKVVVKKKGRRKKTPARIKIPAGSYSHVPADPERVFQVKEKGPRPKALKAYAEEVGLEAFLAQCHIGEG